MSVLIILRTILEPILDDCPILPSDQHPLRMAATASTSRLQASDLYDPAGAPSLSDGYPGQSRSGRQHDERRERRPSPSYDGRNGDAGGNERNNWRRLTPERGLEPQSQQPDSNGRGYNGNAGYRRGGYSNGAGNADFFAQ